MEKQLRMDVHTHSRFSPDGVDDPSKMARQAANIGLSVWTLTDHCEANDPDKEGYRARCRDSFRAVEELQSCGKFPGLTILKGIELGQAMQDTAFADEILNAHAYDFVIGSLHNSANRDDFWCADYNDPALDLPQMLLEYYTEMLAMVRHNRLDVLGHLTYPLRYITGEHGISVDMAPYGDLIDEILKTLIQNGKGIEINTSGLRQKLGLTMPHKPYLMRYRELGGEIITVGSDAHCTGDMGKGVIEAYALLKECGFSYAAYFAARKPHFITL